MLTQSMVSASCGHSERGGSGRRSASSASEAQAGERGADRGQQSDRSPPLRGLRRRQRAAEDRHADKAQQQAEAFARGGRGHRSNR
jgi:hypothetical protein